MKTDKKNWATPEVKLMDIKTTTRQTQTPPGFPSGSDVCDNPPCS